MKPRVLEFGGGFLLYTENYVVRTANTNGGVTFANGFESVLDLEEMAIGWENCDRSVVSRHFDILLSSTFPIQTKPMWRSFLFSVLWRNALWWSVVDCDPAWTTSSSILLGRLGRLGLVIPILNWITFNTYYFFSVGWGNTSLVIISFFLLCIKLLFVISIIFVKDSDIPKTIKEEDDSY